MAATSALKQIPPYRVLENFLPEALNKQMLEHTVRQSATFIESRVGQREAGVGCAVPGVVNSETRSSLQSQLTAEHRAALIARLDEVVPSISKELTDGMPAPHRYEIERVVHRDGGFFKKHRDTHRYSTHSLRILTGVYYYSKEPTAFSGGALRLYSFSGEQHVDIEPKNNSIVFFSSIVLHEVMPVFVPGDRFGDARFSINCWLHRLKAI